MRRWDQAHDGQRQGGLAAARFAHQTQALAGLHVETYAVDRLQYLGAAAERAADSEVDPAELRDRRRAGAATAVTALIRAAELSPHAGDRSRRLIEAASRRQKWIDQSQSLNLYIANPSGKKLDALYRLAWARGLKTTYYLRSRSATHVEKSTLRGTDGKLNSVASMTMMSGSSAINVTSAVTAPDLSGAMACSIDNPECEACQ